MLLARCFTDTCAASPGLQALSRLCLAAPPVVMSLPRHLLALALLSSLSLSPRLPVYPLGSDISLNYLPPLLTSYS
jgi:hypothetical protein